MSDRRWKSQSTVGDPEDDGIEISPLLVEQFLGNMGIQVNPVVVY